MPPHELSADDHDGLIGGRFEVVRTLGDGSFATVLEAVDTNLDRRVALKLFDNRVNEFGASAALREARAMARVNHENVLAVHDIGEHRGTPFLAIEFAETDLRQWLARAPRTPAQILHLFAEAGAGLAAAHEAGLVHHDFKPANVLVRRDGSVAVGDFGLARTTHARATREAGEQTAARSEARAASQSGCAFGTLRYICPERLVGEPGDARSDQFSFCVALWEALAERDPFAGGSTAQARYDAIVAGPARDPVAPLSPHVIDALRRGLALEPGRRFASMSALLAALSEPAPRRASQVLRGGLRPVVTSMMLAAVFLLGVGVSREAPALDVDIQPAPELLADAAMDYAHDRTYDGDYKAAVQTLMHAMPSVREADAAYQHEFLIELEVLAGLQAQSGAFKFSAMTYAAALSLAGDLNVDTARLSTQHSAVSARARQAMRERQRRSHMPPTELTD